MRQPAGKGAAPSHTRTVNRCLGPRLPRFVVALEAVEVIAGTRPINAVKAFQIELVH
ncbi:MAG: hypothetical protein WBV78_04625 [Roseobacter sp.]